MLQLIFSKNGNSKIDYILIYKDLKDKVRNPCRYNDMNDNTSDHCPMSAELIVNINLDKSTATKSKCQQRVLWHKIDNLQYEQLLQDKLDTNWKECRTI